MNGPWTFDAKPPRHRLLELKLEFWSNWLYWSKAHQGAPGAQGEAGDRRRGGEGAAEREAAVPRQRRHHRRLRRRDERVPQDQRADRNQSLRRLLRQGGRGQARQGRHRLLHTHAGGFSHRGSERRRDRPEWASYEFGTSWWAGAYRIANFSLGGHALGSREPVGRTNPSKRAFDPTGPEVRSSHRKIGSGRAPPVAPPQQMLTDAGVTLALIIGAAPRCRQARSCRIRLDLP